MHTAQTHPALPAKSHHRRARKAGLPMAGSEGRGGWIWRPGKSRTGPFSARLVAASMVRETAAPKAWAADRPRLIKTCSTAHFWNPPLIPRCIPDEPRWINSSKVLAIFQDPRSGLRVQETSIFDLRIVAVGPITRTARRPPSGAIASKQGGISTASAFQRKQRFAFRFCPWSHAYPVGCQRAAVVGQDYQDYQDSRDLPQRNPAILCIL